MDGEKVKHGLMLDLIDRKIQLRAYQLYEERGCSDGHATEDWLTAEAEILKTSILAPLYSDALSVRQ
jgi:hypothetical protein